MQAEAAAAEYLPVAQRSQAAVPVPPAKRPAAQAAQADALRSEYCPTAQGMHDAGPTVVATDMVPAAHAEH